LIQREGGWLYLNSSLVIGDDPALSLHKILTINNKSFESEDSNSLEESETYSGFSSLESWTGKVRLFCDRRGYCKPPISARV